jgi:RNA 3'-terminal phosphate cyclase (ATP)
VDRWSADQLMIYMALAGNSTIKTSTITNHIKTNASAIEKFLNVKFKLDEKENIISI